MRVVLKVNKQGKVSHLGFDGGEMDAQDSPMNLPFDAWMKRQHDMGRTCNVIADEPGTDGKDRSVTLDWSR